MKNLLDDRLIAIMIVVAFLAVISFAAMIAFRLGTDQVNAAAYDNGYAAGDVDGFTRANTEGMYYRGVWDMCLWYFAPLTDDVYSPGMTLPINRLCQELYDGARQFDWFGTFPNVDGYEAPQSPGDGT